jgi:hypothetical protein
MNRVRRHARLDGLVFVVLTVLVWGVNALQRGPWQDDVQLLGETFARSTGEHAFRAQFGALDTPLRHLQLLPTLLAEATPQPIWMLQAICAALWLGHGLLAGWIVGLLLPGRRWTRFAIVCLTLTATSDYTTGSMVAVAYNLAALLALAAAGCALRWIRDGERLALIASTLMLVSSLLTLEVALPAIPFLAVLFVCVGLLPGPKSRPFISIGLLRVANGTTAFMDAAAAEGEAGSDRLLDGRRSRRRVAALLVAWGLVLVPIAVTEWAFLRDPQSYAAVALLPLSAVSFARRTLSLWLTNFTPWRWAFARPVWYAYSGPVIPTIWMAVGSALAAALFLLRVHGKDDRRDENDAGRDENDAARGDKDAGRGEKDAAREEDDRRCVWLAALFAIMALVMNAAYACVFFSELHYRTHILSRIWASLAIGILAGVAARAPRLRWAAYGVVTAFVFFGVWGGMERQDFFLGTWQRHQRELASILTVAPALRPGTAVILRGTSRDGRLMATEADYLAQHWLRLLYNEPQLRSMRLDPTQGSGCRPAAGGLDCWRSGQAACVADGTCEPIRFSFDTVIVLDYDARAETFDLVRSLERDPLARGPNSEAGSNSEAARYRPEDRIIAQPWTIRQRRLLLAEPSDGSARAGASSGELPLLR